MPKALFVVNGLGLGNSTRCHAIIERAIDLGIEVSIATSGNGTWYFGQMPGIAKVYSIDPVEYGASDGQISVLQTFFSATKIFRVLRENSARLGKIIDEAAPDVVVVDSDYNFFPIKKRRIPMIAINNADVVLHSFYQFKDRPRSIYAQFYGVELLDCLFHRWVPDSVISPQLPIAIPNRSARVSRTGPIVRRKYKSPARDGEPRNIVIMLSGSVFGSNLGLENLPANISVDVIGRDAPESGAANPAVRYHGKIKDTFPLLEQADVSIINGGYSAVNEMFCMRKPLIVIPVPRHAEQWVNARTIKELGVGEIATSEDFQSVLAKVIDNVDSYRRAYRRIDNWDDGAAQAAAIIERFATGQDR